MSEERPIPCRWDGEHLTPLPSFARAADKMFVIGEVYPMAARQERTTASQRHYFAVINEAWKNLPEDKVERYATPDHLRKWALIKAGYRDERQTVCASKAEALRIAAFIRPIDDYAVVVASECVVTVYTAKSQSGRAMNREEFQASKQAVMDILADLLGVDSETLSRQTEPA